MKKLSELLELIFKRYEEDYVSPYVHNGVGYTGVDTELWNAEPARLKHRGVGYTGVYYD